MRRSKNTQHTMSSLPVEKIQPLSAFPPHIGDFPVSAQVAEQCGHLRAHITKKIDDATRTRHLDTEAKFIVEFETDGYLGETLLIVSRELAFLFSEFYAANTMGQWRKVKEGTGYIASNYRIFV